MAYLVLTGGFFVVQGRVLTPKNVVLHSQKLCSGIFQETVKWTYCLWAGVELFAKFFASGVVADVVQKCIFDTDGNPSHNPRKMVASNG